MSPIAPWRVMIPCALSTLVTLVSLPLSAAEPAAAEAQPIDPGGQLVSRLDLERYKATIKGLTRFGDRRQGTDRNRAAVDWIETQLRAYGCTDVARLRYSYSPDQKRSPSGPPVAKGAPQGGGRFRGQRSSTGVNEDPQRQPDAQLRSLDSQASTPGEREEVYCTKVGSAHPDEMYIVGAHMDGIGWGEAANDDGSGTALVMELARIFSSHDVKTERSIRFVLWNNEETGLNGAYAYVEQRAHLQGVESPAGSGHYPEPRWLGMVQHDMVLFDHGMPRQDGTLSPTQRPEADVNIEFQSQARQSEGAQKLAWAFYSANEAYATDYPASVGPHMTNTDSTPFMDLVPAISVRENERGTQIGAGWDPHWHQPTDVYATFSDADFRLGLNAAQTTLGAIARLAGASVIAIQLTASLKQGGYVILMRHASSPGTPPDPAQAEPENKKHERQLDETGRASARAMGDAFRRLRIPVRKVLSSPTYRALETAKLAQFPAPQTFDELGDAGKSTSSDASGTRGAWLRSQVAKAPKAATDTVIITHYPNIMEAFADDAKDLAEGEALIYRPDGHGAASLVGRVKIEDWPRLE